MSYGSHSALSHQDMLDTAGRLVDRHLQEDRTSLDLSELLRVPMHTQPSVSGLHDFDYPSLLETSTGLDALSEVSHVKRVPLPPELVEQFGRMQCNCMMGLVPEIERAWLSIDSDIFVWKYEDGGDLAYFDGINETILSAALVKPKKGIFQSHIQYLLVLATPVDIVLLGVSFSNTNAEFDEMHLLPEPLFSIPTDNTYIMSILGTESGRIFMAGKDGCLYELAYQADDGWFSRKCRKVNHSTSSLSFFVPSFLNFSFSEEDPLVQIQVDNTRNILYGRTEKGTLQVYDLGADGKGLSKVAAIPLQNIVHNASHIARTIDRSNFKPLVHIAPITSSESSNVHLVAITQTGLRLYFTTNPFGSSKSRPSMLTLVHVRLPPGFLISTAPQRPNNVHMAYYKQGCMLLMASQGESSDLLWTIGSDSFPFQNQLMESHSTVPVDGRTWSVGELDYYHPPLPAAESTGRDPPVVVTQHTQPPRKFIILSAQGSHILSKLRPVDQLRQLLIDCQGPDSEEVKAFFRLHKIEQSCATCLILACSRMASEQQVADWAKMAFFQYGGEAQYSYSDRPMMPSNIGPAGGGFGNMSMFSPGGPQQPHNFSSFPTPAPGMHPNQASTPLMYGNQTMYQHMDMSMSGGPGYMQNITFSGKHNGICLYLSRILRPIWESMVTKEYPCQTPQGKLIYLTCNFASEDLGVMLDNIRELSDFVDFNSKFDMGPTGNSSMVGPPYTPHIMGHMDEQTRRKLQIEAMKIERASLQHIQELIHRVEEVLGLLRVLIDHQFHTLACTLTQDQQNQLKTLTFKLFVTTGKDLCGSLIQSLINRYLDDNATTDAISTRLREICPSLYSTDDATCSKANEMLQLARQSQSPTERRQCLHEALRLYKGVSQPLSLSEVCNQFASVHFYDGIVDLCLTMANKRDPQKLALHFYNNDAPPDDIQGVTELMQRKECYKCITETLGYLLTASVPQGATVIPKSPGPPPAPDASRMSIEDAEYYNSEVFRLALKSDDELFHVSLYEWLFSMGMTDKLLEIQTPFLEPFLKRRSGYQSGDVGALDLLWKYYEKIQNYPAAARILARLAERHGTDVDLQKRIVLLSRAIICAKSSTSRASSAAEGEFLHELEEKMEVARLQMNVLRALNLTVGGPDVEEAMSRLESDLLDITMLYEDFADRFNLSECKLAIVHCAGLYDSALIENLWQNIIDKELENTRSSAPPVRVKNISNKLCMVGKTYIKAERYFPFGFIVKYLEQRSCELQLETGWVFQLMLDIGTPALRLLELYDRMFKSRDPFWSSVNKPLHLLQVIYQLLNKLCDSPTLIPTYERRQFSTLGLDYIACYLVELQSISSVDVGVRTLVSNFKGLQAKMERL
ncbi:nuclear pore complex protein Nup155-like [Dreissena polymorpha]|uniref:nuclear pore complex protein Nup155-like n=1 Tax=Dreissena polymorpha TaxID=45954 RepID=UPI002264CE21|nr:nuclear pore complex protein Nup155-like [Dreissena polymorpha]XP_052257805.1 nuclear pore complex protein Nup155-like [Dreissena polymorpha]XP_052257806.1 nuclear pore complex protein Nup155-like [Dreissena polymorpha]